jgi:ABC-type nickel/cobalt efflux system permease component RcnA
MIMFGSFLPSLDRQATIVYSGRENRHCYEIKLEIRVYLEFLERHRVASRAALQSDQMTTLLSIIALGFFLGMRHATDPDHVIAVTTIVSRQRSVTRAAMIGVLWGLGHTITILVVGSAIILFNLVISPRVGLTMELSVGLMLILLGVLNLSGVMRLIMEGFTLSHGATHSHPHIHGDYIQTHSHDHYPESHGHTEGGRRMGWMDRVFGQLGLYQILRPLAVGIVHGLAGSSAVALLVLTTIRAPFSAVMYLLVFGIGTIAGMMLITAAIALPFAFSGTRFIHLNRGLAMASGLVSLCFGLFVVYQTGFVNGLFNGNPNWVPR